MDVHFKAEIDRAITYCLPFGHPSYVKSQDVSVIGMPQQCHFYPCEYIEQIVSEFGSASFTMHNGFRYFLKSYSSLCLIFSQDIPKLYNSFYRYIHEDVMKLQSNIDTNACLEIISTHCLMFL